MLEDGEIDGALAVDVHDVGLHGEAVGHCRHVAQRDVLPSNTPIGRALNRSTSDGLEFITTLYSRSPMRAVPAGTITLDACSAFTTSVGENPLAASRA